MQEKFLPIGTVVLLKNGTKKVMITSYLIFSKGDSETKKMYDYGGCPFPEGIIESDRAVGFDHAQIEKVVHMGHEDEEQKKLKEILNKTSEEVRKKFQSGEIK